MKQVILNIIQVWDPYELYIFPEDEYIDFVIPILDYINNDECISEDKLSVFLYELIPPIDKVDLDSVSRVEYTRVAKLLLSILR